MMRSVFCLLYLEIYLEPQQKDASEPLPLSNGLEASLLTAASQLYPLLALLAN